MMVINCFSFCVNPIYTGVYGVGIAPLLPLLCHIPVYMGLVLPLFCPSSAPIVSYTGIYGVGIASRLPLFCPYCVPSP